MEMGITTSDVYITRKRRASSIEQDSQDARKRPSDGRNRRKMLRNRLSKTLPLSRSQINALPVVLGQLCHTIGLLAGETMMAMLCDPSTDISLIIRIKLYGKRLSVDAQSDAEIEAATVIYFAAIASALVNHDRKITKSSYERLLAFLSYFAKEKWIPGDLSDLFRVARRCCRARIGS